MIFKKRNWCTMGSRKEQDLKEFLIATRKKIGPGVTNAPVWILQKAGKRIWNPKQKRTWKQVGLGKKFRGLKKGYVKKEKRVKKKLSVKRKGRK